MDQNQWAPATTPPSLARKASALLRRATVRIIKIFGAAAILSPLVLILFYWKATALRPIMSGLFEASWPIPLLPMTVGIVMLGFLLEIVAIVLSHEGEV